MLFAPIFGTILNMKRIRNNRIRLTLLLLAVCLAAVGCGAPAPDVDPASVGLTLEVFSVGKADAMLLTVDGYNVLIDAGENGDGDDLVAAMSERGIEKLDLMILTHFDKDHIGGADKVLKSMPVDAVRMPAYESDSKQYRQLNKALAASSTSVYRMTKDATFSLGGADFIIWVSSVPYDGKNDNEQSLVTKMVYSGKTYLFTGDAEEAWLKSLCFSTRNLTCDVLKMPHHGVYDPNLFTLLTLTMPGTAILTDSEKNPADEKVLSDLELFGADTYRTANGSILVTQNGTQFSVSYTD